MHRRIACTTSRNRCSKTSSGPGSPSTCTTAFSSSCPGCRRGHAPADTVIAQRDLLDRLIATDGITSFILWYYTPGALPFSAHLHPAAVVYDCMDELSSFRGAAAELPMLEGVLMRRADVMFTGGHSLYDAKRSQHTNIHAVPSSVDLSHFAQARRPAVDPADQCGVPRPRLGFFGVLDERLDLALLQGVADARPDWQLMMIGPVVKIDPADLPRRPNIHYLGPKTYAELPAYIGGGTWRCCCSRAMTRRGSSAPPRLPNTWPPGSRSCRRRSPTSCAPTVRGIRADRRLGARLRSGLRAGAHRSGGTAATARRSVPTRHVVGPHVGPDGSADACRARRGPACRARPGAGRHRVTQRVRGRTCSST